MGNRATNCFLYRQSTGPQARFRWGLDFFGMGFSSKIPKYAMITVFDGTINSTNSIPEEY